MASDGRGDTVTIVIKFRSLAKKKTLWISLAIGLMFALPAIDDGCGTHEPWSKRRPKNVPTQAFYVPTVKTYWYVHCWLDQADSVNRCRIYHSDGTVMYEDAYLPYQGTGPVPPERLEVSRQTGSNGPYVVYLRDGTILLTRSDFDHQKRFVDWILGERKSPAE
jgi:hypothetical protein